MASNLTGVRVSPAFTQPHAEARTVLELRKEAMGCQRCDLYKNATQTVFGEGSCQAKVMLVGEQPGDREDMAGRPFVGPAGKMLDECLEEAGIDRAVCYVTNAVKHFKFTPRGKRRIHSKPTAGEVKQCAWWLGAEIEDLRPDLIVALGATALYALMGRTIRLTEERGRILKAVNGSPVLVTVHPSSLLRVRGHEDREAERSRFVADLNTIGTYL